MALDEKIELEYMLLTSYLENGFTGRDILLRISFDVLKQIEEGRGDFKINQNEVPKFKSFMQLDIISKIMMYIEDLAIISESFLLQRNFYEFVFSSKDLGEVIRSFFEKINCLSYEEIYKVMSYATSSQINIDDKSRKILDKHLRSNVSVIRRNVRQIGEFGTVHHPLFKRFKHAGMPIMCGNIQSSNPGFLGDFEFCNMISIGTHPFRDVVPIPYSKQALDSYYIIIHGLRQILKDMVNNRIICIQRNLTGLIPNERYDPSDLSSQEADSMKKMVENFYAINPVQKITISSNYSLTLKREKIAWYLNIREFLNQCKKIKDLEDVYNSELQ